MLYCCNCKAAPLKMASFEKELLKKKCIYDFMYVCVNHNGLTLIFRKRGEPRGDVYSWSVPPGLQTGGCGASVILHTKPWLYNHDPQPPWVRTFGLQGPRYCFSGKFKMQVTECDLFFKRKNKFLTSSLYLVWYTYKHSGAGGQSDPSWGSQVPHRDVEG